MGVLNATPDSFSDGGRYLTPANAVEHGLRLLDEGAGGGEVAALQEIAEDLVDAFDKYCQSVETPA